MLIQSPHLSYFALACSLFLTGACLGQTTERVSLDSLGTQGNGFSTHPSLSTDGRYVAFSSGASNLVPGDTNGNDDIFVHDRLTGLTERVSVNSNGAQGNGDCLFSSISGDGRYVAFTSWSTNLVLGDSNGHGDVFVHNRLTRETERVSVDSIGNQGISFSWSPSISENGRFVAFSSESINLVPGDTNWSSDIFVHDRMTRTTERVSVDSLGAQANNSSYGPTISANGRHVAFPSTASNLVSGDWEGVTDIFVHDRLTGKTSRMSVDSNGNQGFSGSAVPSISADGRYVAFHSFAPNLVPGDTNNTFDTFVHDRLTSVTERVSVTSLGAEGDHSSVLPSISANGRYVAFASLASNLVPGDTNDDYHTFVHDRLTGITERVSVTSLGMQGDDESAWPSISGDGRIVGFSSDSYSLVAGDTNSSTDIFVHDRWDGKGANSIYLTGPSLSPVLVPVHFSWQATRGNSQYSLMNSQNLNGAIIGGHKFDLGNHNHFSVLATGTNSANGMGSFTAPPVRPFAAGHTIYFEIAVQDVNGVLFDSNVHAVTFF